MSDVEELQSLRRLAELEDKAAGKAASPSMADHGKRLLGAVAAPFDYATHVLSGMAVKPLSDIAGLAGQLNNSITGKQENGQQVKEDFQRKYSYQPKTDLGREAAESPNNPLNMIANYVHGNAQNIGNSIKGDEANDTLRGMLGNAVAEAIPQLIGLGGVKFAPQISGVAQGAAGKVADAGSLVADKARTLVSSKAREAKILNDMIPPEVRTQTLGALENPAQGLPGEQVTAGQALAGTNAAKLSALLKMAESRMPEKFGMGGPVPSGQIPLQNVESRTNALRGVAENAPAELRDLLQSKLQPGQQMPNITDANSARQALNSLLIPEKEAALASANIGNQRIIPLREIAADEANRAANSVDTVRRLGNTGQTAQNLADSGSMNLSRNPPYMNDVGNPRLSGRYSYADELAKRAEGALGEPAQQSLMHGGASRLAAEAAQGLESQGYKPLSVNSLIAAIDSKLATPGVGIVPDNSAVLNAVKAKLKEAGGNSGGYVNAIDLDAIRSKVINNTIEDLMKDANPARRGQAAGLAMDMKDAVKQAIESVGGKGYIKHLEEYTTGRKNVGDMQNADSLVGKYRNALDKESPQSFATELRNLDNPPHSPELNKAVSGVTDSLVRGQKYDANARAGNSEVARMIGSEVLPTLPGVGPMSMKISLVRNLINRFSGNLTESSLKNIAKIADDPAKILEAIKRRDISPSEHRVLEMLLHQNMAKGASASIPSNRLSDLVKEQ